MIIVLISICIILSILFPKSNKVFSFFSIVLWIIIAFNNDNSDYLIYRFIYAGDYLNSIEPGFVFVLQLFSSFGIPFEVFRGIFTSVALLMLLSSAKKIQIQADCTLLTLILLFPFFFLVIIIRWTFASSIVIKALTDYMFSGRNRKDKFIYILFIAFATLFHYSMFLFAFVAFMPPKTTFSTNNYIKIIAFIIISNIVTIANLPSTILMRVTSNTKVLEWFTGDKIGFGLIVIMFLHITNFELFVFINKRFNSIRASMDDEVTIGGTRFLYCLNVYSFLITGLYIYNMEFFSRLYIVIYILDLFWISRIKSYFSVATRRTVTILQLLYAIGIGWFMVYGNVERIIYPILNNNILFR